MILIVDFTMTMNLGINMILNVRSYTMQNVGMYMTPTVRIPMTRNSMATTSAADPSSTRWLDEWMAGWTECERS